MKKMKYIVMAVLLVTSLSSVKLAFADSTTMQPVTWRGDKWEYLVEYPRDTNYIDPVRFEEVLDNAGQHGWELVEVSHESHFYAFYFKRPLYPHRIEAHRAHLAKVKGERAQKEAMMASAIQQAYKEKIALEKQYAHQIAVANKELKQEVQLEKQVNVQAQKEVKLEVQAVKEVKAKDQALKQENKDLMKEAQLAKQADNALKAVKRDETKTKTIK